MKTYKVRCICEVYKSEDYLVEAENEEEAQQKADDGEYLEYNVFDDDVKRHEWDVAEVKE